MVSGARRGCFSFETADILQWMPKFPPANRTVDTDIVLWITGNADGQWSGAGALVVAVQTGRAVPAVQTRAARGACLADFIHAEAAALGVLGTGRTDLQPADQARAGNRRVGARRNGPRAGVTALGETSNARDIDVRLGRGRTIVNRAAALTAKPVTAVPVDLVDAHQNKTGSAIGLVDGTACSRFGIAYAGLAIRIEVRANRGSRSADTVPVTSLLAIAAVRVGARGPLVEVRGFA